MPGTVIFDLDRTLTRQPTWTRFVWRMNRHRPAFWARMPLLLWYVISYKLGLIDRTSVKNRFMRTLTWAGEARIREEAGVFAVDEVHKGLRAGVARIIREHRKTGDRLYLATAASDFIANPIAHLLEIEGVICTNTIWHEGIGLQVDGQNCYGQEKVVRVTQALERGDIQRPLTVYSDHVSDLPLLLMAEQGIAANPSWKLRREAKIHGLPIMNLSLDDVRVPGTAIRE